MTTKPKAKKFRIRRSPTAQATPQGAATPLRQPAQPAPQEPAQDFGQDYGAATPLGRITPVQRPASPEEVAALRAKTHQGADPAASDPSQSEMPAAGGEPAREGEVSSAQQVAGETDINEIRKEGLTGRQLRMARRVAQKYGIPATSDFDAVRQLRMRGIDPFQRVNMLELVVPGQKQGGTAQGAKLPQTVPAPGKTLPATQADSPMERRVSEVAQIQRDIARRRRRKSLLLLTRLAFFVMLPTLICGFYFYAVATPMYATKSEFLILKAESGPSAVGGLLSGTQFATSQDAIAVQSYLQSKDAMLRLDEDLGFKSHFSQERIDPIQRLESDATNEVAYKTFKKNIEIGFDPTEGVIRMEVVAADPEVSAEFSRRLIAYAEERVDSLSQRKRANQVKDAEKNLEEAQTARRAAQETLVRLQQENALIDPQGEIAALRQQITTFETQLREKEIELQALLDNARPNRAKVDGAQGDIRRLENALAQLRAEMTDTQSNGSSLAELAAQIQLAQADVATRDLMLTAALEQLSQTRRDANSQVRYLTTSVEPVPPQDATYPRKFENTVLAFLIFAGIYLMISLTASILREQVSS